MVKKVLIPLIAMAIIGNLKVKAKTEPPREVIYLPIAEQIETVELKLLDPVEKRKPAAELTRIRATCYLPTGKPTASGVYPYEGIIAANREHLGKLAAIYTEDMKFIGYFECKDTGGHIGLKNGTRIDVYRESEEKLKEWIKTYGDYVYIQWIESEG